MVWDVLFAGGMVGGGFQNFCPAISRKSEIFIFLFASSTPNLLFFNAEALSPSLAFPVHDFPFCPFQWGLRGWICLKNIALSRWGHFRLPDLFKLAPAHGKDLPKKSVFLIKSNLWPLFSDFSSLKKSSSRLLPSVFTWGNTCNYVNLLGFFFPSFGVFFFRSSARPETRNHLRDYVVFISGKWCREKLKVMLLFNTITLYSPTSGERWAYNISLRGTKRQLESLLSLILNVHKHEKLKDQLSSWISFQV